MNKLVHLDLRATTISDAGIEALMKSQSCSTIEYLDISNNLPKITDKSLISIASSPYLSIFINLDVLRVLKSDENYITNQGLNYLFEFGKCLKNLKELQVSSIIHQE